MIRPEALDPREYSVKMYDNKADPNEALTLVLSKDGVDLTRHVYTAQEYLDRQDELKQAIRAFTPGNAVTRIKCLQTLFPEYDFDLNQES